MIQDLVRVIITGICTFVEADVGDNNRPMTAVFANAWHHDPPHQVNLIISDDDYLVETDLVTTVVYNELGKPFRIVLLHGKTIALAGIVDPTLELTRPALSSKAKKEHRPTTLEELASIEWIPSLGRSWPRIFPLRAARRMRRGFYGLPADPHLVAASFEMPRGTVASHWVSGDIWRFTPRSRTRRRYETAIAQEVRFNAHIGSSAAHFDVCDLRTRKHCGFVRVTRKDPNDRDPIQVVLANVPDRDRLPGGSIVFCGECGRSECHIPDDPFPCTCVDHHYVRYYDALNDKVSSRPSLPRRIAIAPPLIPIAMRVGGGNCPPTDYP